MTWNDVALVRRQFQQLVEPLQHFTDMQGGRKRTLTRHVLVEMTDVGGQHDEPPAGSDANELKPGRVAACRMDREAGSEFGVAIVEKNSARIVEPHNPADVFDLERMRQPRISHKASRGIRKLALLEMEARIRKPVEIAHMIVMQMGEDDILDRGCIDAKHAERLHRTAEERPLPPGSYFRVEARVDDERTASPSCQPHEIVHWHRAVVRIAADEVLAPPRIAGGVADS